MGFSVEQKTLADLLGMASKIAPSRTTLSILECVRITFGTEGVMVEATNMENWVSGSTADFVASKQDNCTAIVPCKQFHAIVSSIPKGQKIDFNITEQKLMVKTATAKYNFGRLPEDEWPKLNDDKKTDPVTVKAGDFAKALAYVMPSIAVNDVRYMLCGLNLKAASKKNMMRLAGADGHRVSFATIPTSGTIKTKEGGLIIPRDSIVVVGDLISKADPDLDLKFVFTESRYSVQFIGDYNVVMIGRLIDGQFPDVDRFVPYNRESYSVTIPRQETINAMQRIATMAEREKGTPSVKMAFSAGSVKLSATATMGDAEETFPSELLAGKGESIIHAGTGVIIPLLNVMSGNDIVMMFNEDTAFAGVDPIILCERDAKIEPDSSGFSIFMPVRG